MTETAVTVAATPYSCAVFLRNTYEAALHHYTNSKGRCMDGTVSLILFYLEAGPWGPPELVE